MSNSNTPKYLFVTGVRTTKEDGSALIDKNDREYKWIDVASIQFNTVVHPLTGKKTIAKGKTRTSAFKAYKKNYLNDEEDYGFNAKVEDAILGDLVVKNTSAYMIDDREVKTATALVIGDSTETVMFAKDTARAFKDAAFDGKDKPLRFTIIEEENVVESEVNSVVAAADDMGGE